MSKPFRATLSSIFVSPLDPMLRAKWQPHVVARRAQFRKLVATAIGLGVALTGAAVIAASSAQVPPASAVTALRAPSVEPIAELPAVAPAAPVATAPTPSLPRTLSDATPSTDASHPPRGRAAHPKKQPKPRAVPAQPRTHKKGAPTG